MCIRDRLNIVNLLIMFYALPASKFILVLCLTKYWPKPIYLYHGWKYIKYLKQQGSTQKRGVGALHPRYHP